ncbi:MAG: alkaline phosphatase family protein [bacterium]|nr:alkaline phosphatase family protein [bacterium]
MAAFLFLLATILLTSNGMIYAQKPAPVPRLIVLISYDQYRGDYIDNFKAFAGVRGFERMRNEGAMFSACMYTHANLMTGPGHATLMTGCNPKRSGIPSNDFCDSEIGRDLIATCTYCANDFGKGLSPANLIPPTLGDLLREQNPKSKSVGIAIKDRAAILMSGHNPTAAVWMDFKSMSFTTSPFYKTPTWLGALNKKVRAKKHANATWTTSIAESKSPAVDDQMGEGMLSSGRRTFPYTIPAADNANFFIDYIRTPYNVRDLFTATRTIIDREKLGRDAAPDVLCVGVSTTDFVGHTFGPDSREVQELYVECDKELANFIDYLDKRVGRSRYLLVVTSDHGVAPIPEVIKNISAQQKTTVDAGRILESQIHYTVDSALNAAYGVLANNKSWCREIFEPSIYLSDEVLAEQKVLKSEAAGVAARALRSLQGIAISITNDDIEKNRRPDDVPIAIWTYINNSYSPTRSGDILLYPKQYWIFGKTPATHGTPYEYDRHVPLLMLGGGIEERTYSTDVSPIDIAPTLAKMFGITMLNVDGNPLPISRANAR